MVYILVALALFALLTAILVRQGGQGDNENLTQEMAQFESTQILAYAQSAQRAVDQMVMTGVSPDDLHFDIPGSPDFDSEPSIYQIYHPDGGGLVHRTGSPMLFATTAGPAQGWYLGRFNNVQWTPTPQQDIILAAHGIKQLLCETINEKILGARTIPAFTTDTVRQSVIDATHYGGTNDPFTTADCADCEGMATLCVSNPAGTVFTLYSIIYAR